ncbi:MAG TPA: Crp/Fnr family transcriptional regulator [Kiritimatiellia bacterium]|nr:Crp/Fnr family transcriptional regulator [Kiritimatiellia bacterium]HSA19311.1 Crp/Fnr family transcriptional regulator [Kiritimatiellia bacterium]
MADPADLKAIEFFAGCTEQELRDLAPLCRRVSYRKFQPIYNEGEGSRKIHAVLKGEVVLHKLGDGTREPVRLAVVRAGEMFGFGEAMLETYYTSAGAATACILLEIGRDDFVRRFLAVPAFRVQVVRALSKIARYLVDKAARGSGLNDLALYLQALSGECGENRMGKIFIRKKLHQPEVASLLNLSREHVTRLFARLKAEGVVDFNRGYPIIDRAWLDRVVRDKDLAASIQYRDAPF